MAKNQQIPKKAPATADDRGKPRRPDGDKTGQPMAGGETAGIINRQRTLVLMLLLVVGAGISALLMLDHHGVSLARTAVDQVCGEGEDSGCSEVARSGYSTFGGVSLAAIGLFFYSSLLLLTCISLPGGWELRPGTAALLLGLLAAAVVLDAVLLGLQVFAIEAFCKLCLATYVVNIACVGMLLPAKICLSSIAENFRAPAGKMTLTAWGLASLMLVVSIGTAEYALAAQRSQRDANILGSPTAPPASDSAAAAPESDSPAGEADSSGEMDSFDLEQLKARLAQARTEITRLEQTLDDPKKYQEYQLKKAAEEFEKAPTQQLDLANLAPKGPLSAAIKIVEYSDFLCPYCQAFAKAITAYLPKSRGRVAVYFKNYPLDQECHPGLRRTVHPGACKLAMGAICAQKQGRFWAYHDKVFAGPPKNPSVDTVAAIAKDVGADKAAFFACLGSSEAAQELANQIQEAKRAGVTSTPSVFLNGRKLPHANAFLQGIKSESKRLGLVP